MDMASATILEQVQQLADEDKLEIIYALWDSMDHEHRRPSTATLALVQQRAEDADTHPEDQITSDQFWAEIDRRYA